MFMIVLILQHLLFSVTDPQFRVKPAGVSDVSLCLHWFLYCELQISLFESFSLSFEIVCVPRLCGRRQWESWKVWKVLTGSAYGLSLFRVLRIFHNVLR